MSERITEEQLKKWAELERAGPAVVNRIIAEVRRASAKIEEQAKEIERHKERWQVLVNAVAGAFNRGAVPGGDQYAVEWARQGIADAGVTILQNKNGQVFKENSEIKRLSTTLVWVRDEAENIDQAKAMASEQLKDWHGEWAG